MTCWMGKALGEEGKKTITLGASEGLGAYVYFVWQVLRVFPPSKSQLDSRPDARRSNKEKGTRDGIKGR
jgi:hypothetical protein